MSRLATTFVRLNEQGRKALIPYVTAGYPDADITPALMHVLVEAGADVIELGVPFSDPSADGPQPSKPPTSMLCGTASGCHRFSTMCAISASRTTTRQWY
jgi:tryptophan synthase alpha subunit